MFVTAGGGICLVGAALSPVKATQVVKSGSSNGVGSDTAAITLDEFALWLDLQDDYWSKQGRKSIDAVFLFGAALSIGLWGAPFFRDLLREARRL